MVNMGGLSILVFLLLSACGPFGNVTTAVPAARPIEPPEMSVATVPAQESTEIPPSPMATGTIAPTWTPTLPPEIFAATATQLALEEHFPCAWTFGKIARSPDGRWFALGCYNDVTAFFRLDDGTVWYLTVEELVSSLDSDFYSAYVFHWSGDSEYAYWGAEPHLDGYWEPFHSASHLFRLHLETGHVEKILPRSTDSPESYAFGFSPDDGTLVYIETDKSPVILRLLELETGAEQAIEFDPKYNTGGGFVWAPDGQRFVFSVVQFVQEGYDYPAASIYIWDLTGSTLTLLVGDFGDFLEPIEWVDETKIVLKAWIGEKGIFETQLFELDLTSPSSLTPIDTD